MAYGERNTLEQCLLFLQKLKNTENLKMMTNVFRLFAVDCVRRDLGFYLVSSVVSREAASAVTQTQHKLIKDIANNVDGVIDSLNVPLESLHVPIAIDYEKFYSKPNYGEVARM